MSTYAKADRKAQWFAGKFGSAKINPNCVVWHSTETYGWPGYSGGSMAPNYTVLPDVPNKRLYWRAHFEDEQSSRALVNAPGGVDTNTSNAVQVEIIGTCNPDWARKWPGTSKVGGRDYLYVPEAPEWFLAGLADFVRDMSKRHGVPMRSGLTWAAYPGSYGTRASQRMSFAQWRAFYGHCGHQHVPENDHGDPGALNMTRILAIANGTTLSKPVGTLPTPATTTGGFTVATQQDAQDFWTKYAIVKDMTAADPNKAKRVTPSNQLEAAVTLAKKAADAAARAEAAVGKVTAGAIDYELLATKVADKLAARLKD